MSERVRVLRVIEYDYANAEAMLADRRHWHIQGVYAPNAQVTIHSAVVSTIHPATGESFHFTEDGPGFV